MTTATEYRTNSVGHDLPLLSTPDDIAAIAHVSVKTVHDWRLRGKGPRGVKVGRHLRYRREDVLAWLDSLA